MGLFNLFKQKESKINKNSDRNLKESEPLPEKKLLKRIKRSKDENELMEIIIENSSTIVRDNAFNALKNLIRTDFSKTPYFTKDDFPDLDSREMAEYSYDQITNQKQIEELALLSSSELAKKTCIPKIENSKLLSVIALMGNDSDARASAVANDHFNNDKLLFRLAQNDKDGYVRRVATSIINNQDDLIEIAKKNTCATARKTAVERIESDAVLTDVLTEEKDWDVLQAILFNDNFVNQEILEKIATGKIKKFQGKNVGYIWSKITNEKMLQEHASKQDINDDGDWSHLLANDAFTPDIPVVEEIAMNKEISSYSRARHLAIKWLSNTKKLEEILFDEENYDDIRYSAINRLIQINGSIDLNDYAEKAEEYDITKFIEKSIETQEELNRRINIEDLNKFYCQVEENESFYVYKHHEYILNQIQDRIDSISKNNKS